MSTKASDRILWAVDVIDLRPDDDVLEIGCGHGVAVSLVCERLVEGRITAVDRSETMIAMAGKRNAGCIAAGKAEILLAAFPDLGFRDRVFAKVFAIHVPLFRGDPEVALATLRSLLTSTGTVYLINQPLRPEDAGPWVRSTSEHLAAGGFDVREPVYSDHQPPRMVCVSATVSRAG